MKFGIYAEMQTAPGKPHADMIWEILRQIEHADQVGFDVYSVIDHHFFQKFSISANPLALFSAAAQRTERIRFRVALFCLLFPSKTPCASPDRLLRQTSLPEGVSNAAWDAAMRGSLAPPMSRSKKAGHATTKPSKF